MSTADPVMTAPAVRRVTTATLTGPVTAVRRSDGASFDAATYSWMKHGRADAIDQLGAELAEVLLDALPELGQAVVPPAFPVAYHHVPPSCYFLTEAVLARLNPIRSAAGLAPARIVKVDKDSVTHTDYASSTMAERRAELARIGFTLAEPVDGADVVVIDDVRVTGMAEETIMLALRDAGAHSLTAAYLAVCDDTLSRDPHVEAELNHAAVTSILDLVPAIRAGNFHLTIRFLKRALASPELADFAKAIPSAMVRLMYAAATCTGPDFVAGYPEGMATLRVIVESSSAASLESSIQSSVESSVESTIESTIEASGVTAPPASHHTGP